MKSLNQKRKAAILAAGGPPDFEEKLKSYGYVIISKNCITNLLVELRKKLK